MKWLSLAVSITLMSTYIHMSGVVVQSLSGMLPTFSGGGVYMQTSPQEVLGQIDQAVALPQSLLQQAVALPQSLLQQTGVVLPQLP